MNYSISQLSTIADCDFLLTDAARFRGDLEAKLYSMNRKNTYIDVTSQSLAAQVVSFSAQISALEGALPNMPEGKDNKALEVNIVNLKHKLYTANNRSENYSLLVDIELEYDINLIESDILQTDAYIAALIAKKATL